MKHNSGKLILAFIFIIQTIWAQTPVRLGLNFPFRNPELTDINTYMSHIMGSGAQIYRQMTYADLMWKQVEPTNNNWQFGYADSVFLNYSQFSFVGNLYCFSISSGDTDNVGYQVPWNACDTPPACGWRYENDSNETKDYLSTCINRYQSRIRYWELGNESEYGVYPLGIPFNKFVEFFAHNYRWIKSINPALKVMLPGTLGTFGVPMQPKYDWIRNLFAAGAGSYCNIISFHDYNAWWTTPVHIDSILAIRNSFSLDSVEVWITESSVSSVNDSISPSYVSVDEQAADVWRRIAIAWAKGINTFIWHGCWSSGMPSEWAEFGLLDQTGKKKKAYHAFKMLSEKLTGFSSAYPASEGIAIDDNASPTGGNGIWVMKFVVNGQNRYVMWSRNNLSYQVNPSADRLYRFTQVVPVSISPDGETVVFETDSIIVPGGNSYDFSLSPWPIYVEEENLFNTNEGVVSNFDVEIYPNPSKTCVNFINNSPEALEISVYDIKGACVQSFKINPHEKSVFDVSTRPKGVYSYIISNGITAVNGKFVVE